MARIVTFALDIRSTSSDAMWANYRALWKKIRQARQSIGAHGRGTRVTLGMQIRDATTMVYLDVIDGRADIQPAAFGIPMTEADWMMGIVVTLACEPFGRSAAVSLSVSGTITNDNGSPATVGGAGNAALYLPDIPGDVEALLQIKLIDVSTGGAFLNRMRIARRSRDSMAASTDFDPLLLATANSPGVSAADATAIGGNRIRVTTSQVWQNIADISGASTGPNNSGIFDLWAIARTDVNMTKPTGLGFTQTSAGALPAGVYVIKVTSTSSAGAVETDASDPITVVVTSINNDRIALTWTDNGAGDTGHRVYWKRDTNVWKYLATGSAGATYNLDNETSAVTANPPGTTTLPLPQLRAQVGMSSGTTLYDLRAVSMTLGVSVWHPVYLGRATLPPAPTGEGLTTQRWKFVIQGRSPNTSTPLADVCAAFALPADEPQMVATYSGLGLATLREWMIDCRRDGRASGILRSTADQTEQGQLEVIGQQSLMPGDNLLVFIPEGSGGAMVITLLWNATVTYYPRYRSLAGVVD